MNSLGTGIRYYTYTPIFRFRKALNFLIHVIGASLSKLHTNQYYK